LGLSSCLTYQLSIKYERASRHLSLWRSLSKALLEDAARLSPIPTAAARQLPAEQVAHAVQAHAKTERLRG